MSYMGLSPTNQSPEPKAETASNAEVMNLCICWVGGQLFLSPFILALYLLCYVFLVAVSINGGLTS